jgi:hypothetical protein
MAWITSRRWLRARTAPVAVTLLLGVASIALWPGTAASAASRTGDATVVGPVDNQSAPTPLNRGTTTTPFSLELPKGSSCRGDSANDSYRVQSFMVPGSVDPATLQFGSAGPLPTAIGAKFREPLFDLNTNPYVNAQTANADRRGGPGPIINIPAFNFSVFKAGDVPAGLYNVGIACTKGQASARQLDTFWSVRITVTAGSGATALAWSVPGAPASSSSAGSSAVADTTGPGAQSSSPADAGGDTRTVSLVVTGAGAHSRRPSHHLAKAAPTGAPPSFGDPVGLFRDVLSVPGPSWVRLAVWALSLLVCVRVLLLVLRRPSSVTPAGP